MEFIDIIKKIDKIKGETIIKGIYRVLNRNKDVKPSFSYTWIRSKIPRTAEFVNEYEINDTVIQLYHIPEETEDLYQVNPVEYDIENKKAELIQNVRSSLSDHYPKDIDIINLNQVKKYINSRGKDLLLSTAEKLEIELEENREEKESKADKLSKLISKYTAGYGLLETLLIDPDVEDIYADAPSNRNCLYVELRGQEGIRDRCRTNIFLSKRDMDSIISRFRSISGKPFSEAFPVLEGDLPGYNTRPQVFFLF